MRWRAPHFLLALVLLSALFSWVHMSAVALTARLTVVANTKGQPLELTQEQIRHIYMGGALSREYIAVHLKAGTASRREFNHQIIGLTEARIQSFWAQQRFSGRAKPPREFDQLSDALEYVGENVNSMTYVPQGHEIPAGLTVVYPKF